MDKIKILTIDEVADLSGKSQKTIRREIHAGNLKAEKIQNHYRIKPTDFNIWISNFHKENNLKITSSISNKTDIINWVDISDKWGVDGWKTTYNNGLNFIDLFSGAGGLSCGLVMAGFKPLASVEIMPQAVETYKNNFSIKKGFNDPVEAEDIRKSKTKEKLYNDIKGKKVDLIVGGYPCQGFSLSGYRVVTDPRNSLYLEMLKIVKKIKPDFIVMENVEGLRSMLNGKIEEKIINDYKKIGYSINVTVLNSADYGVPQIRNRVIFIGNRVGKINLHPKAIYSKDEYKTVKDGIERFMFVPENPKINHIFTKNSLSMKHRMQKLEVGKSLYQNYSDSWKKVRWDLPSCTIKENHGGVNIHPILSRSLTPRELASLQSFPDDFIFYGSKKWQLVQIGNAVPPLLGKAIGLAVEKAINSSAK